MDTPSEISLSDFTATRPSISSEISLVDGEKEPKTRLVWQNLTVKTAKKVH